MEPSLVGLLAFAGMLALIMLGVPIIVSMAVSAFAGLWLIGGQAMVFQQFATLPYWVSANYAMAVIPMFILMGVLAGETGIAEKAYNSAYKWFGSLRGGLLLGTIGGSALFGACSGSSAAGSAVFTKMAQPEIKKYNYDLSLSLGCIASAGGLAALIPPSIPIVILCVLLNLSIGKVLVGGIGPGLLMTALFILTILFVGKLQPEKLPRGVAGISLKEKISSLKLIWPIGALFLLIIGGMYFGVFPPTVGGGIGSVGVIAYGLALRASKRNMAGAFWETAILNAQLFPLIIFGFLFARMIAVSGLPNYFLDFIRASNLHPLAVMGIVLVFYIFMGSVMELMSMLIITLPLVFPILTGLGFDPIAVAIIIVLMMNIGGLTPPIGMSAFVVASVAKVPPSVVFRGITPFFFALLVGTVMLVLFPQIASWLPNLFFAASS